MPTMDFGCCVLEIGLKEISKADKDKYQDFSLEGKFFLDMMITNFHAMGQIM